MRFNSIPYIPKYRPHINYRLFYVIMTIFLMSMTAIACEPLAPAKIQNNTNQMLTVFVAYTLYEHVAEDADREQLGSVEPGKVLKPESMPEGFRAYLIEARDARGNIVYSKEYNVKELRIANWKVVISTSQ